MAKLRYFVKSAVLLFGFTAFSCLRIIRQYKLIAGFCYAVIFISSCINHQDRNFAAAYRRAVYIVMTDTIEIDVVELRIADISAVPT